MKGEALGILTSLMAASMVIGPIIGGALFVIHDGYPYFFAGFLMLISLFITLQFRKTPEGQLQPAIVTTNQTDGSLG
jgi:MFS family permease